MSTPVRAASDKHDQADPNAVKCKTPVWDLKGKKTEATKLDVALNGQNFQGGFGFTFTEVLALHRSIPMAGPLSGSTNTRLLGSGFRLDSKKMRVAGKWGPLKITQINKDEVMDYVYQKKAYENMIEGSQELKAYWYEATDFARVDSEMKEDDTFTSIYQRSARMLQATTDSRPGFNSEEIKPAQGGPWYVEVGTNIQIPFGSSFDSRFMANSTAGLNTSSTSNWTYYDYEPSTVEFYQYT